MKKIMKKIMVGVLSVLIIMPTVAYAANSGYVSCQSTKYTQYGIAKGYVTKNDESPGGHRYITEYKRLQSNVTGTAILSLEGIQYAASTGYNRDTAFAVGIRSKLGLPHYHSYTEGITSR